MDRTVSENVSAKIDMDQTEKKLSGIRADIDKVDKALLELLNKRAALSVEVGRIKRNESKVFQPQREYELLEKLSAANHGSLPDAHMRAIWREIISSSRALQQPQQVAYLGPIGTFSYFAAREYMGSSAEFVPCRDIVEIFEKVSTKACCLGVVPLENSLQGTVGISVDLFLANNVEIVAELFYRISQSLLSNASSLDAIKKVYSHPQPLVQCGKWLRANLPNAALVPVESTAAAAKLAAADPDAAAVGNRNLASMYNLKIFASHIEDNKNNWTRFVIISLPETGEKSVAEDNKSSLIFTIPDRPGSLAKVLNLLGNNGLNMRKLESRPMSGQPWKYVFFVDIENNLHHPAFRPVLEELETACVDYRILGSYPFGVRLEDVTEQNDEAKGVK